MSDIGIFCRLQRPTCHFSLYPDKPSLPLSHYISWSELPKKTFGFELLCTKCKAPLHLIALSKREETAKKILDAMHLPREVPQLHPACSPPTSCQEACGAEGAEDWVN
jgi:hypothetical protein